MDQAEHLAELVNVWDQLDQPRRLLLILYATDLLAAQRSIGN